MTAEFFDRIGRSGAWVDLSSRAKFALSGADRVRYLNGQVTNDVRKASQDSAIYACVTNAKGRIEADVFIHASTLNDGCLMLDAEGGLRDSLSARLEKYIVADDVTLTDVTDEWRLLHVFGAGIGAIKDAQMVKANRLGVEGVDVWLRADSGAEIPELKAITNLSAEEFEALRILRGIPRWPNELNADAFPQEAGMETRAMDFAKGCYIGQEVLSRIKMSGKMPRTLVRWRARTGGTVTVGDKMFVRADDGVLTETGIVTSAARHPELDRDAGLGYVRQGSVAAHPVFLAGSDPAANLSEVEIIT